jgi:peptidoglycan/LPS O-acetylase OafA/YrhL
MMRLQAFDSLRGLAAASVTFYHCLLVFPWPHAILAGSGTPYAESGDALALALTATPIGLLWAGREAVLLFFVLSGFVLALSFEKGPRPSYLAFAAKRAVRLILPCAAVVAVLAVAVPWIDPVPRPDLSDWFNASWNEELRPGFLLGHALLMLGEYPLNNPMWTLHYELRISLLFPAIALLAAAGGMATLAAAVAAVFGCLVEMRFLGTGALTTLLFLPHFALGALLCHRRRWVAQWVGTRGAALRAALWSLCYLLLTFRWLVDAPDLILDLISGSGAALLLALVLGSAQLQTALSWAPLRRLGEVSYSLYLVHVPVLLAALHLAPTGLPTWLPVALTPPVAILLALLLHRMVEAPAIRLGRRVAAGLDRRRNPGWSGP